MGQERKWMGVAKLLLKQGENKIFTIEYARVKGSKMDIGLWAVSEDIKLPEDK